MMNLFWNLRQSRQIGQAQSTADQAVSKSDQAKWDVFDLERRLDKLMLVNMAMWSLLQERTGLTEEDLIERVRQIDLSDGRADGKVRKEIARCGKCGRVMSKRHQACMYCGADNLEYGAFDSV